MPNDESKQWLYKQRIQQKLQEIPESINIVLGKYKTFTPKNKNTWDDDIKLMYSRKIRKRHHKSWGQFLSHLEYDIQKIKPNNLNY